jgi:hypothetical protein
MDRLNRTVLNTLGGLTMLTLAAGAAAAACPETSGQTVGPCTARRLPDATIIDGRVQTLALPVTLTLAAEPEDAAGTSTSTSIYILKVDDREVKVTVKDGQTSVEVDGQKVDASRYTIKDGVVTVKDEKGEKIAEIITSSVRPGARGTARSTMRFGGMNPRLGEGGGIIVTPGEGGQFTWSQASPPPVMLGVTTAEASEDLIQHLGLEEKSALLVSAVVPDSPAAAAGLKKGDLIYSLNGERLEDPAGLRQKLMNKKPGDEVKLGVYQNGQKKELTAKLAAYDETKFSTVPNITRIAPELNLDELDLNRVPGNAEMAERLQELAKRLQVRPGDDEAIRELREKARQLADEAKEQARRRFGGMNPPMAPEAPMVLMDRGAASDARLRRLEDRLARIEALLEQIAAKQNNEGGR